MDNLLTDSLRQLLAEQCTASVVRGIEGGGTAASLWSMLEESGFADALVPEADGGAGLGLAEVFALMELCGMHAVPVPLSETMLARPVLSRSGIPRPMGSIAFAASAAVTNGGALICREVSFGRVADWVIAAVNGECLLLEARGARSEDGIFCLNAQMQWSAELAGSATRLVPLPDIQVLQACACAAQLAGAALGVFNRTLQYANERTQFGKPIGKFQAIQHQLSLLAEHAYAARMAARIGCQPTGLAPDRLRVAVAKARTSEAALECASLGHSIHGAIGFTEEFDLQLYTRRLHALRQTAGSEAYWQDVLGAALLNGQYAISLDFLRETTALA